MQDFLPKVRHTVWLGDGPLPYPECEQSIRAALPCFVHYVWTKKNIPSGFPILNDMIKHDYMEIASEYLKVLSLARFKGVYLDYNVYINDGIFELLTLAIAKGLSVAQHPPSYAGVDYLSTEIMVVPHKVTDKHSNIYNYILDYKSNFEYFYSEGERDPNFFGSNLFSRCHTNKILTNEEAYGVPHVKCLEYRSDKIVKFKRPIIPYQAFYATPEEMHSLYNLGHVKPKLELSCEREIQKVG